MKWIKSIISIVVIAALLWFVWTQLQSNQAKKEEIARLAEQVNDVFPVEVTTATLKPIERGVVSSGTFIPGKLSYLISDTQGKVIDLKKRKGDYVKAGEVIAKVDPSSLEEQLALANANLEKLEKDAQRFENLLEGEAITQRQVEEVEIGIKNITTQIALIEENLQNTALKAPISGYINMLFIEDGSFVGGGMQIAEIVDINTLKLMVRVAEERVVQIRKGQKVKILMDVFPDHVFSGTVTLVAVKADFGGKYQVEVQLDGKKGLPIKAGMFAKAVFSEDIAETLVIPRAAIISSIQSPEVFQIQNNRAQKKSIEIDYSNSEIVEVTNGLNPGDTIVLSGQINLVDGTKVKVVNN